MANKLIGLSQLQRFKEKADLKYQNKLTAGSNISITNNVISAITAQPTYTAVKDSGDAQILSLSITNLGSVVLLPGKYFLVYTCYFRGSDISSGSYTVQCGFSTNTTDITGFGRSWGDNRAAKAYNNIQTSVSGVFEVSASSYPNGRTFYMLAQQNSGSATRCYPRCYYIKF